MIPVLGRDPTLFPAPSQALSEPDGLLAVGGDLSPERLCAAYRLGIFPWYEDGQPILWWSPDPRMVLYPAEMHVGRTLRKTLRQSTLTLSFDRDFEAVIRACAEPRPYADGTWITEDMVIAYLILHRRGFAHSVEVWDREELVGGFYGVALGRVFFGESMFSRQDNASKIAFARGVKQLETWGYELIDCQVSSDHLAGFGARPIPRETFQQELTRLLAAEPHADAWRGQCTQGLPER